VPVFTSGLANVGPGRILEHEATFRLGMLTDIAAGLLENIQ